MKIAVYGTLKRGHHNNVILMSAQFLEERTIKGFKLMDSGFPVAIPDEESSIKAEIWDIGNDKETLRRLDMLEGEGRMYVRTAVDDFQLYVGHPTFWKPDRMQELPSIDNVYEYQGYRRVN